MASTSPTQGGDPPSNNVHELPNVTTGSNATSAQSSLSYGTNDLSSGYYNFNPTAASSNTPGVQTVPGLSMNTNCQPYNHTNSTTTVEPSGHQSNQSTDQAHTASHSRQFSWPQTSHNSSGTSHAGNVAIYDRNRQLLPRPPSSNDDLVAILGKMLDQHDFKSQQRFDYAKKLH